MAREASRQEKIEANRRGLVNDDDDVDFGSVEKSVKEKEVDGRLMKFRKSLEGNYKKLPNVKGLRNESEGSDDGEEFGSLMFKKKYKYKSQSVDSGDKPMGFGNGSVQTDKVNDEGVSSVGSNNNEPRNKLVDTEAIAGTSKELHYNNQASNMETRKPQGFGQESSDTVVSAKKDDSNRNGGLNGRKGSHYVAVHIRGEEDEESGLFIIRSDSQTQTGLAHTVAFEDHGETMNFCYLLESFFEDLEDFNTNIQAVQLSSQRELKRKLKKGLQESLSRRELLQQCDGEAARA
ncbi:hypothetical protein Tco_1476337 [Tanacetum coccineum]